MIELHMISGPEPYRSFKLKDRITHAGRSKDKDIQIKDQTVFRKHLKIARKGNQYFITDKGQGNLIELSSKQSYFWLLLSSISDTAFHIEENRFSSKLSF